MSRQRLRSSLSDMNYRVCPRCEGMGTIRSVVSSSLNLMRIIEDEALKENTEAIQVAVPLDMATYLLNEKRHELYQLEAKLASRIIVIPSDELTSPHFHINRLKSDDFDELSNVPTYSQKVALESTEPNVIDHLKTSKPERAHVQLDQIGHSAPPPEAQPQAAPVAEAKTTEPGLIKKIMKVFSGSPAVQEEPVKEEKPKPQSNNRRSNQGRSSNQQNHGRGRQGDTQSRGQNRGRNTRKNTDQDKPANQNAGRKKAAENDTSTATNQETATEDRSNGSSTQNKGRSQNRNNRSRNQGRSNTGGRRNSPDKPQNQNAAPESSEATPGNDRNTAPRKSPPRKPSSNPRRRPAPKQQPHPGPIISVENIPTDLPDDIGNRKD